MTSIQNETIKHNKIASDENLKNNSALTMPLLHESETLELIASSGELGIDPSSDYFTKRTKNIAYVLCLNGRWFQIHAHCFTQSQKYNDFSGGYKRCYREMPKQFVGCEATQKVLNVFKSTYNIPDNEPVLVQVQKSHLDVESAGKCLTGQGIHSDGADRAMLVCLERNNITVRFMPILMEKEH